MYKKLEPYLFIASILALVFVFYGCEKQPEKVDTVKQICESGYVYNVIEGSYKEIVRQNGSFKTCESGKIIIREF